MLMVIFFSSSCFGMFYLFFKQFAHILFLSTSSHRANVEDAMQILYKSVKSKLIDLPLLGNDLFSGKFIVVLEPEVNCVDTAKRVS